MKIQVKDFMSTPVTTAVEKDRICDVRKLMERKGIHALPVISYSKKLPDPDITIKGIVTATDLSRDCEGATLIEDIMTAHVHVIHKHSSVQAAARMMVKQKVHHLVVMDDGKITGMISSLDFVKLVAEYALGEGHSA